MVEGGREKGEERDQDPTDCRAIRVDEKVCCHGQWVCAVFCGGGCEGGCGAREGGEKRRGGGERGRVGSVTPSGCPGREGPSEGGFEEEG